MSKCIACEKLGTWRPQFQTVTESGKKMAVTAMIPCCTQHKDEFRVEDFLVDGWSFIEKAASDMGLDAPVKSKLWVHWTETYVDLGESKVLSMKGHPHRRKRG